MLREIRTAAALLNWRKVGVRLGDCPLCGRTAFVKLDDYEMAVRCLRCRSSGATLSFVSVLKGVLPDLSRRHVYELSSRGPLVGYLRSHAGKLTLSEYFDDVPPGQYKAGVQCQDVQQLTYPDGCFDVCTSTEVFEHVPRDLEGFRELYRVLSRAGSSCSPSPWTAVRRPWREPGWSMVGWSTCCHRNIMGIVFEVPGPFSVFATTEQIFWIGWARPVSAGVTCSRVKT